MTSFELISAVGLIVGPIAAAVIAFKLQDRALHRGRKLDVFRTLMRSRRTPLSLDHVGALNLTEIDFAGDAKVLGSYAALIKSFNVPASRFDGETHQQADTDTDRQRKDNDYGARLYAERQGLLVKLLSSMGKSLGYKIEQLEILEGGYHPTFFANIELQQEKMRLFLNRIVDDEQSFPIRIVKADV